MSSSIPSSHILTAHAQPFRGARDMAFCLKVPLDSLLVWASSGGSGDTARMRRLAWTFAARIGDKYQIRLTRSNYIDNKMTSTPIRDWGQPVYLCNQALHCRLENTLDPLIPTEHIAKTDGLTIIMLLCDICSRRTVTESTVKFWTPKIFAVIILKLWPYGFSIE